jgi:hypothetical protein
MTVTAMTWREVLSLNANRSGRSTARKQPADCALNASAQIARHDVQMIVREGKREQSLISDVLYTDIGSARAEVGILGPEFGALSAPGLCDVLLGGEGVGTCHRARQRQHRANCDDLLAAHASLPIGTGLMAYSDLVA